MEYELVTETINPCGGSKHAIKEFSEIETDDPAAYVREHGRFPVLEAGHNAKGDLVITTGDGKGYFIKYTFSE